MLFEGSERRERERRMKQEGRLPPGQSLTLKWPVLHYGSIPGFQPKTCDFQVFGLIESQCLAQSAARQRFSLCHALEPLRQSLGGCGVSRAAAAGSPQGECGLRFGACRAGVYSHIPLADLDREEVLLATHHDGEPLAPDHGYPLRLIVSHLYAWKSVKWVRSLEFLDHDVPGFWEQNGYHMYGDPWTEQRFTRD
jgi:DMSO/TMAO reductase YedYZ molybdopterin-dependent catalytic subunit